MATCEKTGLQFEARSTRVRNHPRIMSLLGDANRDGYYGAALDAIKRGKEAGFTTLEQFEATIADAKNTAKVAQCAAIDARIQREREEQEAKRQRHILNSFLNGHGYNWRRFENDEEDQDRFNAPAMEWNLWSADNVIVSVKEAMIAIASKTGDEFAHAWLAERGIEIPAEEPTTESTEVQEPTYTAEQIAYQQEAIPALLEAGLAPNQAEREAKRLSLPHSPQEDAVPLRTVRLPTFNGVLVINSDFRYGVLVAGRWHGIGEILAEHPELNGQLAELQLRNELKAMSEIGPTTP